MAEHPLVSVIIPTHNRRALVTRAINSVRAQTIEPIEIVVVDDGSTDGTADELERRDDVVVIRLPNSVGAAAARNRGIREARAELIAFLDSDDEWLPEKLEEQLARMEADPCVGAVYCRHFTHDEETGVRREAHPVLYTGHILPELLSGRCPRTVSLFLVRKSALQQVGGFDESLRGFQDTDLWIRLASNWLFDAVDMPLVVVHNHPAPRITTDIEARLSALDSFLGKWGDSMAGYIGRAGLARYRREQLAVAQGTVVLSAIRSRNATKVASALWRYLRLAGVSNRRQLAGLLLAAVAGDKTRRRLKRFRQLRGR